MPASATWHRHRLRWIGLAVAAVVLALLAALAIHVSTLLRPGRFTTLLERQLADAGITLQMEAPARPALFPRPAVRLQGFSIANEGSTTPILQADGATIVVPWRALLHGDVAIERVDVDSPRIDLGELRDLLARLPRDHGPPNLPTILTGVQLSQGTLTSDGSPILFGVDLATGALMPNRPFRMEFAARGADGVPVTASLALVPSRPEAGTIALDDVAMHIHRQNGATLALRGRGDWQGGEAISLGLAGTLAYPALKASPTSAVAPAASAPSPSSAAPPTSTATAQPVTTDKLSLKVEPARGAAPLTVALTLTGADIDADLTLRPAEVGPWWQRLLAASPGHPPGPLPVTGKASAGHLALGPLQATGVTIDAESETAPASAASTSAAPSSPR